MRPMMPAAMPLISDSPESEAITLKPSTPSAKYAIGVNESATRASGSVNSTSMVKPNKPPSTPE